MKNLTFLITFLLMNSAIAQDVYSDQFQTIQSVELAQIVQDENGEEVERVILEQRMPSELEALAAQVTPAKFNNVGNVIMVTRELIALGKEIYKIVEAGRPTVTINTEPVQVLPIDDSGNAILAMQLHDWQRPKVLKYRVSTRNYLGMKPASFDFLLIYSYGGQLNGKGRYITGAQIKPTKVDVAWGYNLDASFSVQSILNEGSSENPVAGAVLMIDYKINTVLMEKRDNKTFYINGNGHY